MRRTAIAALAGACVATVAQAEMLPTSFESKTFMVCADRTTAIDLMAVYEEDVQTGEKLLSQLADRGACERATFSGRVVAKVYPAKEDRRKSEEGYVLEVDVTQGDILKGRTRAYVLLYVLYDNET